MEFNAKSILKRLSNTLRLDADLSDSEYEANGYADHDRAFAEITTEVEGEKMAYRVVIQRIYKAREALAS